VQQHRYARPYTARWAWSELFALKSCPLAKSKKLTL
jgi:hypothetical protein